MIDPASNKPVWEMRPYLTQLQGEVERLRRCLLAYHKFRLGVIKQIVAMGGMDPNGHYIVSGASASASGIGSGSIGGGGGGGGSASAAGAEDDTATHTHTHSQVVGGPPISSNKSELEFAKKYLELRDEVLSTSTTVGRDDKMPYYLFRPPVPCSSVAGGGGGGGGAGSSSSLVQVRVINGTTTGGRGSAGASATGSTPQSPSLEAPQVVMLPDSGQLLTLTHGSIHYLRQADCLDLIYDGLLEVVE